MHTHKKFRLTGLVGLFCILTLFIAACGGSTPTTPSSTNTSNIASDDKQVLRIPTSADFDTLDPALTNGAGEPFNLIYQGLVTQKSDGTVTNQLAESQQVSSDGLTYTFKLKSGLKFDDGTALTADDIAYSINRTVLPATGSAVSNYLSLLKDFDKVSTGNVKTLIGDSIIVKDPQTIVLVLSKPAAYFLQTLSYPTSYVVNKKIVDKYGDKWTDHLTDPGASSGPYKVASYDHQKSLDIVPNSTYFGVKPKLKKISWIIAGDRDANYKSFQAGQFDVAPVPPSQDPVAKTKKGYQQSPALASRFIGLNYLAKPFDIIKIRQAFALAINRELIVGRIIGKNVNPINNIVPKGIPGYNENLVGPAGVKGVAGDVDKAKQLLKEGLQEGKYASVANLPPITLNYALSYKAGADTMQAIAASWKEVLGITVKLVGVQGNDLIKQENQTVGKSGPLMMWYGNWGADYSDPQDWLTLFFGKGESHNTFNYGQNNSTAATAQQAVQDQLAKADIEQDNTKRIQMYQEAEQKIVEDVGWITTYQSSYSYAVNPKLVGWKLNPQGFQATDDYGNIYFTK